MSGLLRGRVRYGLRGALQEPAVHWCAEGGDLSFVAGLVTRLILFFPQIIRLRTPGGLHSDGPEIWLIEEGEGL